jgi:hypothetical protein
MQESTIGSEILVTGGTQGKEKSTRSDGAPNAYNHLLHAFSKRTVSRTANLLI